MLEVSDYLINLYFSCKNPLLADYFLSPKYLSQTLGKFLATGNIIMLLHWSPYSKNCAHSNSAADCFKSCKTHISHRAIWNFPGNVTFCCQENIK